ncbi:hypothetical protein ACHAXH_003809 [Discostella pseudostelligera]
MVQSMAMAEDLLDLTEATAQPSFDNSVIHSFDYRSSAPQPDRVTTNTILDTLLHNSCRPEPCDTFGSGPLFLSDIPAAINNNNNNNRGVIMGIDEAGRGPVLGPMAYAAAFWDPDSAGDSIPSGFNDSKQLTPEKRASLFNEIRSSKSIGFVLRILHASEISRSMLRKVPYNLNAMSHDAAMEMIWAVLNAGVKIDTCYIDTVGIADSYRSKLERVFEGKGITFIVEKKADAKYAPCSAASVVAKESRDTIIANWKWTEAPNYEPKNGNDFGSGYPSDPKCKVWLDSNCNVDVPFGFPDFVRFSWAPVKNALKEGSDKCGHIVRWEADEDEETEESGGGTQSKLDSFVVSRKVERGGGDRCTRNLDELRRKKARLGIYNELGLTKVIKFVETVN